MTAGNANPPPIREAGLLHNQSSRVIPPIQHFRQKRDVRLSYLNTRDIETLSVWKNGGNKLVSHLGFSENCRVPCDDWCIFTTAEQKALLSSFDALHSNAVTILKIGAWLLDEFHETVMPALRESNDPQLNRRLIGSFSKQVLEDLYQHYRLRQIQERGIEVNFSPAGSPSTAFNFETQQYMGLHIDNHEHLPLTDRGQAFQLLNINIGRTPRYFCFVDQTVPALANVLRINEKKFEDDYRLHTSRLKDLFLAQYADYPILRVQIDSGSAYIATTQNLIHDGTTNEDGNGDITLLISGRFVVADSVA